MFKRIKAIFYARNKEFFRDHSTLTWTFFMPIVVIAAFAFAFSNTPTYSYKIGIKADADSYPSPLSFLNMRYVKFIDISNIDKALPKVEHHQLDMLLDRDTRRYWINTQSSKSYFLEKLLHESLQDNEPPFKRLIVSGDEIRYVDWLIPGLLSMNIMFGALWGIGYVIVRYRKNGVLKRLRATPISATEFLIAQLMSRLWLIVLISTIVFLGTNFFIDFQMRGHYIDLLVVFIVGSLCLISIGLIVASRISSEALADGLLNLLSWPMIFFSEVWFSLESTNPLTQTIANLLPLTHLTKAARDIMIDGANLLQVADHLSIMLGLTVIFLVIGTLLFRWE